MPPTENGGGAVSLMARAGFQPASCGYDTGLRFSQAPEEPTGSAQKQEPETALGPEVPGVDLPLAGC